MKKDPDNFRTHIREPRWQQVLSVVVVGLMVILWIWLLLHHR
jgi:hypothetical protein